MVTPRTLSELRAAVARVLQARGEAADALVCEAHKASRGYPRGRRWYVAIQRPGERGGPPPSWSDDTWAADEAGAIGEAWHRFVHSLCVAGADALDARKAAERRYEVALAALAAAREIGGTDG